MSSRLSAGPAGTSPCPFSVAVRVVAYDYPPWMRLPSCDAVGGPPFRAFAVPRARGLPLRSCPPPPRGFLTAPGRPDAVIPPMTSPHFRDRSRISQSCPFCDPFRISPKRTDFPEISDTSRVGFRRTTTRNIFFTWSIDVRRIACSLACLPFFKAPPYLLEDRLLQQQLPCSGCVLPG